MTDIPDTEHTPRDFGSVPDENDYTAAKRAEAEACPDCGHEHTGKQWAYICVGCPCERRPNTEQS